MLSQAEINDLKRSMVIAHEAVKEIKDRGNRLEALLVLRSAVQSVRKIEAATQPQPSP